MSGLKWGFLLGAAVMLGSVGGGQVALADGPERDASVKKYGVAWNVADDRKFENINGVYQPEDLDKYMKRYFEQLFLKMSELSLKMDDLSGQIRQMDAEVKAIAKKNNAAAGGFQSKLV